MATSTAQTIPLVEVYDYVLATGDPSSGTTSKGLTGKKVKITLNYDRALTIAPDAVVWVPAQTVYSAITDLNGFWHVFLVPNNKISPANTFYTVEVEGQLVYQIQVTDQGVPGPGWQSSAPGILLNIPAALAPTTSTVGAITATGLITAQAGLNVSAGGATIAGGLTVSGGEVETGGLTVDTITYSAAVSRLIPGATSFSVRDNANANDNLLVTNAGNVTARGSLTVTTGPLNVTAGGMTISAGGAAITGNSSVTGTLTVSAALTVQAGGAAITGNSTVTGTLVVSSNLQAANLVLSSAASLIVPGATSLALMNNAQSANNLFIPDNGQAVFRNGLALLGGTIDVGAGTIKYTPATANQGAITAQTDLTGLSITFTAVAGRRYRITGYCDFSNTNADVGTTLFIVDTSGPTQLVRADVVHPVAGGFMTAVASAVVVPGAASKTYKLQASASGGTTTLQAALTSPAYILIEDIGT